MRPLFSILFLIGCSAAPEKPQSVDIIVDDFGLYDQRGDFHTLHAHTDASAIVLFVQGNGCPIVRNAVHTLNAIRDEYAPKRVQFFMLNANLQDGRQSIRAEADAFSIDYPILVDETQLIAESLDLRRTAEALVIDPKTWHIRYRGPVDDRLNYEAQKPRASVHYLADALRAHLEGKEIVLKAVASPGCLIALPGKDRAQHKRISYAREIAPILKKKCVPCHQPGGIAPFDMADYKDVAGWSPMMREVVRLRRMPPWHADPHIGTFSNDMSLSLREEQTLIHWIEAGSPRGDGPDPLAENPTQATTWAYGEPDLIMALEHQEIPATGIVDYRYLKMTVPIDRDVWVRGTEFLPGNRAVMHHALARVIYPKGHTLKTAKNRWLDGIFASYVPGMTGVMLPKGTARWLPKRSKIQFQIHYTTTGRPEVDDSKLGLYFTDGKNLREHIVVGPANLKIKIPPHARAHRDSSVKVFKKDVTLYSLFPHMHFRGAGFRYVAHYPDDTRETLLSVPNYTFNWQRFYALAEPKLLPAGTRVVSHAVFDNSAKNKLNPDPSATVRWGEQSFDEMLIGYMSLVDGKVELTADF